MITEPKLDDRGEQLYMGIRTQAPMQQLGTAIPALHGEVLGWLGKQSARPAGAPFIRYHVIDMAAKFDIELGWPVATALAGEGRVHAGVLPAGRYASLVYTGPYDGLMEANAALLNWGAGCRMGSLGHGARRGLRRALRVVPHRPKRRA